MTKWIGHLIPFRNIMIKTINKIYMRANFLNLIYFTICMSCTTQNTKTTLINEALLYKTLDDSLNNEYNCEIIQNEINKLYFMDISNNLLNKLKEKIKSLDEMDKLHVYTFTTHNLSYCSNIKSHLGALLLSNELRDSASAISRFYKINNLYLDSLDHINKTPISRLLFYQGSKLKLEEKKEILDSIAFNANNTKAISCIIESETLENRLDLRIYILNLCVNRGFNDNKSMIDHMLFAIKSEIIRMSPFDQINSKHKLTNLIKSYLDVYKNQYIHSKIDSIIVE